TGSAPLRIASSIVNINDLVNQMAGSAEQQASTLGEINTAIRNMDAATQQNAAMGEESAAAAGSLAREADAMAALVAKFEVGQAKQTSSPPRQSIAPAP